MEKPNQLSSTNYFKAKNLEFLSKTIFVNNTYCSYFFHLIFFFFLLTKNMDEVNKLSKAELYAMQTGTFIWCLIWCLSFCTSFLRNEHGKNAQDLRDILGGLKGPIMKIAQLLFTVPDLLPDEQGKNLLNLQFNFLPPMGWNFVKRRMKNELDLIAVFFESFEKTTFLLRLRVKYTQSRTFRKSSGMQTPISLI